MFSPQIVSSDAFLDMPTSSRELYFQLGMYADDDGFVNPKKIVRMIGASDDDLKVLIAKRFVIPFESGVVVIKHWAINNLIRKDWHRDTVYQDEMKLLEKKENGAYTERKTVLVNESLPNRDRSIVLCSVVKEKKEEKPSPDKPEIHLSYLKNIPEWDVKEFTDDYKVTEEALKAKALDLFDWCEANGKRKKNYKAFLRVAVKKDFGKRTPQDKILEERIQRTRESMQAGPSPFAKSLMDKMKM